VRHAFLDALKKVLNEPLLAHRWFTLCFLTAFEPNEQFKEGMVCWLKNVATRYRIRLNAMVIDKQAPEEV
jgi:sister chromatid cohesion protein PDS5